MRARVICGLLGVGVAILLISTSAGVAQAATGDLLRSITAANPENCPVNVGLAFDGRDLLVPCVSGDRNGSTSIDYIDPTDGSLVKSLEVPLPGIAAVAYDAGRDKLWACDSPTGGNDPASGTEAYVIDPVTGDATDQFPTAGCWDGLAYDAADDTLWVSPDQSDTIYHYTSSGNLINSFSGLTRELGGFGNSGIAVGGADLYLSNADGGTIYTSPKDFGTAPAPAATEPGQHIEDMECDSVTFAPKDAMWVISAFDRTVNAYEIPAGSCGIGGRTVQHTLTVSKSGTGSGTVTSSPSGLNCDPACAASFATGTIVTLTATAAQGSSFAGWSGAGCSGTLTCQVTMDNDGSVVATFNQAPPPPPPPTSGAAPLVSGGASRTASGTRAIVSGSVNPENEVTTVFFEFGLDPRFRGPGASTNLYDRSTAPQQVPPGSTAQTVSASLTGLVPGALYHVRLVAINGSGTTRGPDETFTTARAAAPPPPVLGHSEDVRPVRGTVFIRTASGAFVRLTGAQQIPSGAVIDALHGTLKITTALPSGAGRAHDAAAKGKHPKRPHPKRKRKTQSGNFGGAIFKITQARSGLSTLTLVEKAFKGAPSFALCKTHKASDATTARVFDRLRPHSRRSSRTLQLLHASAHGKFRTRGRYSAATVRGTNWTIADRCDGTLTHDITHSVAVTDFVRHKTIILHAGQSYLAKARKP